MHRSPLPSAASLDYQRQQQQQQQQLDALTLTTPDATTYQTPSSAAAGFLADEGQLELCGAPRPSTASTYAPAAFAAASASSTSSTSAPLLSVQPRQRPLPTTPTPSPLFAASPQASAAAANIASSHPFRLLANQHPPPPQQPPPLAYYAPPQQQQTASSYANLPSLPPRYAAATAAPATLPSQESLATNGHSSSPVAAHTPGALSQDQVSRVLSELERRHAPPWHRRWTTWVALGLVAVVLLVCSLGMSVYGTQAELRSRLESQQVRLRELGLEDADADDEARHHRHHQQLASTTGITAASTTTTTSRSRRSSPRQVADEGGGSSLRRRDIDDRPPVEDRRDLLGSAAWTAKIEVRGETWQRRNSTTAPGSNSRLCAGAFGSGSKLEARVAACALLDSPGWFSWDAVERFELCCGAADGSARLACGVPAEVVPVSRNLAALAIYEGLGGSAAADLVARPDRRCSLYVIVDPGGGGGEEEAMMKK